MTDIPKAVFPENLRRKVSAVKRQEGLRDLWSATTYDSACDALAGYNWSNSARITVVPGSAIMIQRFSKSSCESETWQAEGEPEPLELAAPEENRYLDLSQE